MSGICGIVALSGGPEAASDIQRMLGAIEPWGGDGQAHAQFGSATFGHQLLRLSVEDAGPHPMVQAAAGVIASVDARLDNRSWLIETLGLSAPARELSDATIVVAAYLRWGVTFPEYLEGAFAIGLWDERVRRLCLVTDPMAVRPLFYIETDGAVYFGSSLRAITATQGAELKVNEAAVAKHLTWYPCMDDPGDTYWQGVSRLTEGQMVVFDPTGMTRRTYWAADPNKHVRYPDDGAYEEEFRALFSSAVKSCMRADGKKIGVRFSGGLDSQAVAGVARAHLPTEQMLPLVGSYFTGSPEVDERPFMKLRTPEQGFVPVYQAVDDIEPLAIADDLMAAHDGPIFGVLTWVHWAASVQARGLGVSVLLDGIDGDSTLSNPMFASTYVSDLLRRGRVGRAIAEARHANPSNASKAFKSFALGAATAVDPSLGAWLRRRGRKKPANPWRWNFLEPDFVDRVALRDRYDERKNIFGTQQSVRERQLLLRHNAFAFGRVEMMHSLAAAHGVMCRHPFADKRLLEFCLAIPEIQKIRNGVDRHIMRSALANEIPHQARNRVGKGGVNFSVLKPLVASYRSQIMQPDNPIWEYLQRDQVGLGFRRYLDEGLAQYLAPCERVLGLHLWMNQCARRGLGTGQSD